MAHIFRLKNIDKVSGILDLFTKMLEILLLGDKNLLRSQMESDIKALFFQKAVHLIEEEQSKALQK